MINTVNYEGAVTGAVGLLYVFNFKPIHRYRYLYHNKLYSYIWKVDSAL